ncbi:MAG: transposase [Nocardioidaceae bacterium]
MVLDVDATIVVVHSEKENASLTFKRTFGFHPLGVWRDNTSEFLAAKLRSGKRRVEHRSRPRRGADRGDRPDPRHPSQEAAGPLRRVPGVA